MKRESSIELLRIIAICGVIILHFNGGIGNALEYVKLGTVNSVCLYFFNSLFICAVNVFILITGFFMYQNKKINYIKPLLLIIQVIIFNEISYLIIDILIYNSNFSLKSFVGRTIPTNYFVILYSVLYILIPYLNRVICDIPINQQKKFITLIFCLFSVYPTFVDCIENILNLNLNGLSSIGLLGSQNGYTIVNFILMYYIGGYLRKIDYKHFSFNKCILLLLINTLILCFWSYISKILNIESSAWNYSNPLVIINACLVFLCFNFKKIKIHNLINNLSKATFSVFLFHSYIIPFFNIKNYINDTLIFLIIFVIISVIIIYLICYIIYIIYSNIEKIFILPIIQKIAYLINKNYAFLKNL